MTLRARPIHPVQAPSFSRFSSIIRAEKHLNWVYWSMFCLQYTGVFQVPKGIVVNDRLKSWDGFQQHYSNVSSNPEFIVLNWQSMLLKRS